MTSFINHFLVMAGYFFSFSTVNKKISAETTILEVT